MFGLPRFPLIFLSLQFKGVNFTWTCLITLSNRWYKNFLPKVSHSRRTENGKIGFFSVFYQRERNSKHNENMSHILRRGSVAHCFTLLHIVRYRTTERTAQIDDRSLDPGSGT